MRDNWATKATASTWQKKDQYYEKTGHNQESLAYILNSNFQSYCEVGSGTGRIINQLRGRRGAIDINPHLLKLLNNDIKKYNLNIAKKTIPDRYELVYSYQVMQHLDHDEFVKALEHIRQIATREIWLLEGYIAKKEDGEMTHKTGSYFHRINDYINCYQIDSLDDGRVLAYRAKV